MEECHFSLVLITLVKILGCNMVSGHQNQSVKEGSLTTAFPVSQRVCWHVCQHRKINQNQPSSFPSPGKLMDILEQLTPSSRIHTRVHGGLLKRSHILCCKTKPQHVSKSHIKQFLSSNHHGIKLETDDKQTVGNLQTLESTFCNDP